MAQNLKEDLKGSCTNDGDSFNADNDNASDFMSLSSNHDSGNLQKGSNGSLESLYWQAWKMKIGAATDKLAPSLYMSGSASNKDINGLSRKPIDIIPKNKSNVSLSDKGIWWSWKKNNGGLDSRLVRSGSMTADNQNRHRSASMMTTQSGTNSFYHFRKKHKNNGNIDNALLSGNEDTLSVKSSTNTNKYNKAIEGKHNEPAIKKDDENEEDGSNLAINVKLVTHGDRSFVTSSKNNRLHNPSVNSIDNDERKAKVPNAQSGEDRAEGHGISRILTQTATENVEKSEKDDNGNRWLKFLDGGTDKPKGLVQFSPEVSTSFGAVRENSPLVPKGGDADDTDGREIVPNQVLQPEPEVSLPEFPVQTNWWNSNWIWNTLANKNSGLDTIVSEESDNQESKEAKKAKKILLGFENDQASCWAFLSHDKDFVIGELAILNTKFEEEPVMMFKQLPRTKMEQIVLRPTGYDESYHKTKINRASLETNTEDGKIVLNSKILVLPSFRKCYRPLELSTKIRLLSRKVFHNLGFINNSIPVERHLYQDISFKFDQKPANKKLNSYEHDVVQKNFLILNIQNFLPEEIFKILNDKLISILTSSKEAMRLVHEWADSNSIDVTKMEIEILLLQGKDTVFKQVENFFNIIIKNWIIKFSRCDYLLLIANFNAAPLAVHLLDKLFSTYSKIFSEIEKIGIVSIDGVWLGPRDFEAGSTKQGKDSKSKTDKGIDKKEQGNRKDFFQNESTMNSSDSYITEEHADFNKRIKIEIGRYADPESYHSLKLNKSLKTLLGHRNTKFSVISNLNSQIVPMYSSLCYQFSHPNINRLFYVDNSDSLFSDFLIKLIEVCLFVKNIGYEDYNMLVYISQYLIDYLEPIKQSATSADSFNIYESDSIYQEALKFCFETTTLYDNNLDHINIDAQPIEDNDKDQIQEGRLLRHDASSIGRSQHDIRSIFKKRDYYINNPQDIIKFHKVNYRDLISSFNEFQYPWILNKLVKELQVIRHVDVDAVIGDLRRLVREWSPKDALSQKLKSSLDVIAVEDYL